MAREHWDFKSPMEDFRRIFEGLEDDFPPVEYKPPAWGTADGEVPKLPNRTNTVEIRPITPPDPPEFIRQWNERANAEQPEWIKRANRKALAEAEAAEQDAKAKE